MSAISTLLSTPPDNFSTTLSSGISSSALTIPLNSVSGLPTEGVGVLFKKDSSGNVVANSVEIIHWTNISGSDLTLTDILDRGITGSDAGAQAFINGDYFEVWVTSYYYDSFKSAVDTSGTLASNSDTKIPTQKAVKTYSMPLSYIDTDGALTANSDVKIPSQKAVKTYVGSILATVYPIGSIYISVISTNPATLFGFGTWVAFAEGRTLVGIDAGQTEFDVVEETGGAKTHTLIEAEMPAHTHSYNRYNGNSGDAGVIDTAAGSTNKYLTSQNTSSKGSGAAHNNLQPYIVTYMWKRTA